MAREMKDSGVEWIGYIPCSWETLPTHSAFTERREKVSDTEWEPLSVTKSGVVKQLEHAAKSDNHNDRKKVCIGDFAINSRSDRKESCGLSSMNGSVSLINTVLIANASLYSSKYVKYLLKNYGFAEEFYRWGTGIVADLWSTNFERMKNIKLPLPPLSEQQKIADFLDEKVKEIDNAIEKTKETIELYKKYKQAIITEAVTKGLDPNVEMKDSGIEWIGKIPSHWEVLRIKHVCTNRIEKALYNHKTDKYLGLENVIGFSNKIIITDSTYDDGYYDIYKTGDVLFNKLRPYLGKVIIAEDNGFCTGEFMRLYNFNGSNQFLRYWMINSFFLNEVNNSTYGAKMPRANPDFILNMPIYMPPFEEQIRIASFLNQKSFEIDKIIVAKNNFINRLNILKKSLIYEYVTGKKEVK